MKISEAAIEILRETGNPAVMWGDAGLLWAIAERAGLYHPPNTLPWKMTARVLAALRKTPGSLIPGITRTGNNRVVSIFRLPENGNEKALGGNNVRPNAV
jgi:hypothetical protein